VSLGHVEDLGNEAGLDLPQERERGTSEKTLGPAMVLVVLVEPGVRRRRCRRRSFVVDVAPLV
jgi:hypothetical protein